MLRYMLDTKLCIRVLRAAFPALTETCSVSVIQIGRNLLTGFGKMPSPWISSFETALRASVRHGKRGKSPGDQAA
jgi:hypothetical protein